MSTVGSVFVLDNLKHRIHIVKMRFEGLINKSIMHVIKVINAICFPNTDQINVFFEVALLHTPPLKALKLPITFHKILKGHSNYNLVKKH